MLLIAIVTGFWPQPLEVEMARVTRGPLTVSVVEEGKTRIRHRHVISAPVSGRLQRISWRPGDRVELGKTVLAELFPDVPPLLNVRLLAEAQARIQGAESSRLRALENLERVRASLRFALREKERSESLLRTGGVTTKEWELAMNQVEVLEREVRAAEFGAQVAEFEVTQAKAALLRGKGSGEGGQSVPVLSPVSGVVLQVWEENERMVGAGVSLMEVGDLGDLEAEMELLSSDAVGVKMGAPVLIERWGGAMPLKGRVAMVESGAYTKVSALGVEEQRVRVRVDFLDPIPGDQKLGDRFRVEARIETWSANEVMQVPLGAMFRRGVEWFVFVVEQGRAVLRRIDVGHQNGIFAEVLSGVDLGQTVIVYAPDMLKEGARVRARFSAGL
jgi:HlyD family secretion protein